ncbi:3-oxoacyl-[acyl-carrier-protein] reductase FabG-like protein [Leptotrombidium deliense]|uniref:3-oxoacyl-[acyl-carrier-protein] reductase FabG-like protein n=1 Tax=Leptotrombidium deliense TaxID=299467 RepID=A0A443SRZ4_9ACAR|nr:3-oxoacyl-[acyl-carrier-protein] reductase FabG-like protein [Leptotrombidium deliense]
MNIEFLKDLENKVVIVTGSSSGIGAATAVLFAELGSKVVITGRNEERVLKVAQQCESPLTVIGDLSEDETVKRLVNRTIETFNSIDCLVNSAGHNGPETLSNLLDDDLMKKFDVVVRLDVRSVLLLCNLCLPHLLKSKGNIVTVSSIISIRPSCADSHADVLVLVHVLFPNSPGSINTPFFEALGFSEEEIKIGKEMHTSKIPLKRFGEPEEVARVIVFLASNWSTYVTGINMIVDGGYLTS